MTVTGKPYRLEVVTEHANEGFVLGYDSASEAQVAAEQIIKQGFAIDDYSKDEATPYHRCYIPLHQIRSLDVVKKEG